MLLDGAMMLLPLMLRHTLRRLMLRYVARADLRWRYDTPPAVYDILQKHSHHVTIIFAV